MVDLSCHMSGHPQLAHPHGWEISKPWVSATLEGDEVGYLC